MEYCEQGTDKNEMYSLKALSLCQQQMPEIVKIIDSQIDPENVEQLRAKNEIIKYLYKNNKDRMDKFLKCKVVDDALESILTGDFANSLIRIANVVDALSKNRVSIAEREISGLPFGDSNTGDQIASTAHMFMYWLLSDENKIKYRDMFYKCAEEHYYLGYRKTQHEMSDNFRKNYTEMEPLDNLAKYNEQNDKQFQKEVARDSIFE